MKVWTPVKDGTYWDKAKSRIIAIAGDMLRIGNDKEVVLGDDVRLCRLVAQTDAPTPAGVPVEVRQNIRAVVEWQLAFIDANPLYGIVNNVRDRDTQRLESILAWLAAQEVNDGATQNV